MIFVLWTGRAGLELCEIEEQGVSFAGFKCAEYVLGRNALCYCEGIHIRHSLKPCNERPLWKASSDAGTGAV